MKLAIVIPWFGRELKGGAEQHAWQVAARLAGRGHTVEVLTTCCRSHQDDWSTNHFAPGRSCEPEGFAVRRFPVNPRNRPEFDRVCAHLLSLDPEILQPGVSPVSPDDSRIFAHELIKSSALLEFLEGHKEDFDAFLFLPYLYGPILDGIRIVGRSAVLQPCLHDESYAYLPQVAEAFRTAGSLLFISEGEQELALRLFGPGIWSKSTLTGAGIETAEVTNNDAAGPFSDTRERPEKFLLYLGRKDVGKNVPLLLDAFARFRRVRPNSPLRLILAGHGKVDLNGWHDAAMDLGLISEEEKQTLLRHCTALVQPSRYESFSRVIMEAWRHGKPVAAHSRCLATSVAVERSGGGWTAETVSDWARVITEIDRTPAEALSALGAQGQRYANEMADWEAVIDRHEAALARHAQVRTRPPKVPQIDRGEVNQFLPNLAYGDAISNEAIFIKEQLREFGYRSEIYVRFIDPRVADQCRPFSTGAIAASDALIYHHSIGTEITPHILRCKGPKCLIYHNITPAEFFESYRPEFAAILRQGREELHNLAPYFPVAVGDSTYNADELRACGFPRVGVLPICVHPEKWDVAPDNDLMRQLQDGRTNVLFVGRISPNKKQDDLLMAFRHYRALDPQARLILIGTAEHGDPYHAHLQNMIRAFHLQDAVILPGNISDLQLTAYYRTARLFWSMSEHEGFCVPLIEAMWFDVPILAFKSSAVPETLGGDALMFSSKENLAELAALAHIVAQDGSMRQKILRAQRRRRLRFLSAEIVPRLHGMIGELLGVST